MSTISERLELFRTLEHFEFETLANAKQCKNYKSSRACEPAHCSGGLFSCTKRAPFGWLRKGRSLRSSFDISIWVFSFLATRPARRCSNPNYPKKLCMPVDRFVDDQKGIRLIWQKRLWFAPFTSPISTTLNSLLRRSWHWKSQTEIWFGPDRLRDIRYSADLKPGCLLSQQDGLSEKTVQTKKQLATEIGDASKL